MVSSTLTHVDCARAIVRGEAIGKFTPSAAKELSHIFAVAEATWERLELRDGVIARAGKPFPVKPIRALDAIHLASAAVANAAFGPIAMLSLDERVRANATALGLTVLPANP